MCPDDYVWYYSDGSMRIYGKNADGETANIDEPGRLWSYYPRKTK